ncbi:pentapeptide repeat-containing protein [Rhodococcus sp. T7]|uniref:pentapeptide repeat-containing protein n=1 Tax=Rhodococcus sp. T7 TaxID=627444 RepID=UPI001359A1CA|nr:pentapeptide repeat-containing protein [Rhodococcus sp. T7]
MPKQSGPQPAWWFKDGVFAVIVGLLVFLFQSSFEAQRELTSSRDELVRAFREQVITSKDPIDRSYGEMQGMNLPGIKLQGANLAHADLSNIVLRSADLTGADLTLADLDGAQLQGILLSSAKLNGASIVGANLEGAALNCRLTGDGPPGTPQCTPAPNDDVKQEIAAPATGEEETSTPEIETRLLLTDLTRSDLRFANLEGADLWSATLNGADLRGANMQETKLTGIRAQHAHMDCIDNPEPAAKDDLCVQLIGATLWGADLRGTNLSGADLTGARLNGAILGNTAYDRSRLRNLILGDANLTGAKLDDICYDETTVWPFGFEPPPPRDRDCPIRKTLDEDLQTLLARLKQGRGEEAAAVALTSGCQQEDRKKWIEDIATNIANLEPLESPYVIEQVAGPHATVRFSSSTNQGDGPGSGSWSYDNNDDTWKYDGC